MIRLQPAQCTALRHWFQPESPGIGLVAPHVLVTGHGAWQADRWPEPRLVMAEAGTNYALRGEAAAFPLDAPPPIAGFVDAPPHFLPVLEQAYGRVHVWPRVLFRLEGMPGDAPLDPQVVIRRLAAQDAAQMAQLSPDTAWIANPWSSPEGLAAGGYALGVFVDGALASVACSFFVGETCEDLGVVTEAPYRGRGYSTACSAALCRDILARGHIPTWSTSTDNLASIHVAQKLGFVSAGEGVLYVIGSALPDAT